MACLLYTSSKFRLATKNETGETVLYNEELDFAIDSFIYHHMISYVRRINGMTYTAVSYTHLFVKTYSSAKAAATAVGLKNGTSVSLVCRGERKSAKGYLWRYHNEMSDK